MGQKDIAEKILEDYNDVFADIVNVLLFDGEKVVLEDDLTTSQNKSFFKADDSKLHQQERDVSKYWNSQNVKIAVYGLENQTDIDRRMPLRVISYDGASYKSQLLDRNNTDFFPVITLVLYFGLEPWTTNRSLYECFSLDERLKPYANDYKINLFQVAYLPDETVSKFKSDFGIIADYFVQKRKDADYKPSEQEIKHVDAFFKMMHAVTGDERFLEQFDVSGGGKVSMCKFIDEAEERGEKRGIEKGIEEGILIGKVLALYENGMNVDEIVQRFNLSLEQVQEIISK